MTPNPTPPTAPPAPPPASTPANTPAAPPAPAPAPAQPGTPPGSPPPATPPPAAPAQPGEADAGSILGEPKKPAEGTAPTTPPAGELKLKLPDGWDASDPLMTSFAGVAKESGLKPEVAQKIADVYVQYEQHLQKQAEQRYLEQAKASLSTVKADKELGGEGFPSNVGIARKAIERFNGSDAMTSFLNQRLEDGTPLGSHPEMLRFCLHVGKALAEDSIAGTAGPGATELTGREALIATMYPTMKKE